MVLRRRVGLPLGAHRLELRDVFRPHNGHWTTLPILEYRLLYQLFGLHDFMPYRLVVLVLYLVAAALLLR